jgi:NAD(P)-dependent dehydrogenase (short-subunit alcohol dehydrogenase family)
MIPAAPPLEIRRYRESDRAAVKALWDATLGHAIETDRDLTFMARWDNARLFVGAVAGAIVATAAAGHEGNRGWLHRVATDPAHRRKGYARQMIQQGSGGKIVNTASISGKQPEPYFLHYGVSKAGVISMTKSAAAAFGPHHINVNAMCPGTTVTDMSMMALNVDGGAVMIA